MAGLVPAGVMAASLIAVAILFGSRTEVQDSSTAHDSRPDRADLRRV
jgi:hypothetical protein